MNIQINDIEKRIIAEGLEMMAGEVEKVSNASIKIGIPKATKEAMEFKGIILELKDKVMGVKKLPFTIKKSSKKA